MMCRRITPGRASRTLRSRLGVRRWTTSAPGKNLSIHCATGCITSTKRYTSTCVACAKHHIVARISSSWWGHSEKGALVGRLSYFLCPTLQTWLQMDDDMRSIWWCGVIELDKVPRIIHVKWGYVWWVIGLPLPYCDSILVVTMINTIYLWFIVYTSLLHWMKRVDECIVMVCGQTFAVQSLLLFLW